MTAIIVRNEFQDLLRDRRFRMMLRIVGVQLFIALAVGFRKRQDHEQQRAAALATERRECGNQGNANPHSTAHFGRYAFKPLLPITLDNGLSHYPGVAVYVQGHAQNPFRFRPAGNSIGVAQFDESTASTLLQILLQLVIILLAFSSFAGEMDLGTLKQLLNPGVGPAQSLCKERLGIDTALSPLLLPATAAGTWELMMRVTAPGGAGFTRLLAMGGAYAVSLLAIVVLALGASARAASVAEARHPTPMDEPTSGPAPKVANEFSGLVQKLNQNGIAVPMASHDLFRAKEAGHRVGIIQHGRLVATLDTADISHLDLEETYLQHMRD
jgi:ABC-2 type transport system permease protein